MAKKFADLLNDCLDRVILQDQGVEECLATYPEAAAELEPLVEVAAATAQATALAPRSDFEAAARYRFHSALQSRGVKPRPTFWHLPRWATTLGVLVLLFLLGGGMVNAASDSLPGERMYPVKRAVEDFRLITTWDARAKVRLRLAYIQRRVGEAQALAIKKRHASPSFWKDMASETDYMTLQIGPEVHKRALAERLIILTESQQEVLEQILEMAPPRAVPALQRALEASRRGHERALESLGKEKPNPVPSGKEGWPPTPRNQRSFPFWRSG